MISRFIVLCGDHFTGARTPVDHLCKFVVNKPLSVSFLSLFCVRTIQTILIQEEIKHWCCRRLTEHRVYCSIWFYDYLRKHVMSIFSWFSMTYLFSGSHCLTNTRVDHAWDCRVIFCYVPWFINTPSLLYSIDDNFNFIMILLSISLQLD